MIATMAGREWRVMLPEPGWSEAAAIGHHVAIYTPGDVELVAGTIVRVTPRQMLVASLLGELRFRRGRRWGLSEGHETGPEDLARQRLVIPRSAMETGR